LNETPIYPVDIREAVLTILIYLGLPE